MQFIYGFVDLFDMSGLIILDSLFHRTLARCLNFANHIQWRYERDNECQIRQDNQQRNGDQEICEHETGARQQRLLSRLRESGYGPEADDRSDDEETQYDDICRFTNKQAGDAMVIACGCKLNDDRHDRNCNAKDGKHHSCRRGEAFGQDSGVSATQPLKRIAEYQICGSFQNLRRQQQQSGNNEQQRDNASVGKFSSLHLSTAFLFEFFALLLWRANTHDSISAAIAPQAQLKCLNAVALLGSAPGGL